MPSGCRIHSVSRGFTPAGLRFVGFIRVRVILLGRALVSSDSFGFEWVYSGAIGVVRFITVPVASLWRAFVLSGSFGFAWVHSAAGIVVFICVRVVSLRC